jgi:hypothetical protein
MTNSPPSGVVSVTAASLLPARRRCDAGLLEPGRTRGATPTGRADRADRADRARLVRRITLSYGLRESG